MIILQKVSKIRQVNILHFALGKCARVWVCHASSRLGESKNVVQAVLNILILEEIHHASSHFNRYGLTNPSMIRLDHRLVSVNTLSSGEMYTRLVGIDDSLEDGFVGGWCVGMGWCCCDREQDYYCGSELFLSQYYGWITCFGASIVGNGSYRGSTALI